MSDVVIGVDAAGNAAGNGGYGGYGGYGILFGILGGNSVAASTIANSGLRAIGGVEDRPGVATPDDIYTSTSNVVTTNNDRDGTQLVVNTPNGPLAFRSTAAGVALPATFTVTNTGANSATDVQVALEQDSVYRPLTITQAVASQGTVSLAASDRRGNYPAAVDLGTLAPGASATITLSIRSTTGSVFAAPARSRPSRPRRSSTTPRRPRRRPTRSMPTPTASPLMV